MPGRRREPYKRRDRANPNTLSELRWAGKRGVIDMVPNEGDLPSVLLSFDPSTRSIDLTVMTSQEVEAYRKFVNDACDMALVVTRQLDAAAEAAKEAGDVTYKRLWRPAPIRVDLRKFQPTPDNQPEGEQDNGTTQDHP